MDLAAVQFEQAIAKDSLYALAFAALGEVYLQKYEQTYEPEWIDKAIENGQRALALNGNLSNVRMTMGMIHLTNGEDEKAVAEFSKALEFDPDNPFAYTYLGAAYEYLNREEFAESNYKSAIKLNPGNWSFYNNLGLYYDTFGRHELAVEQFEIAASLRPDHPWPHNNLGLQYERLGQIDKAIASYQQATRVSQGTPEMAASAYLNLGRIRYAQRSFVEAQILLDRAIELDDTDLMAWSFLANTTFLAGDEREAKRIWEREVIPRGESLLEVYADDETALKYLADAYAKEGEASRARSILHTLTNIPRKEPDTFLLMTHVAAYLGDDETALEYLEAGLEVGLKRQAIESHPWLDDLLATPEYDRMMAAHNTEV